MKNDVDNQLDTAYKEALTRVASTGYERIVSDLPQEQKDMLDCIIRRAEKSKGALSVTMTSIVYKIFHPEQDIRCHQASLPGGYAGRTFDEQHITPFLARMKFPHMAESGWLTRSFEQKAPYNLDYRGAITPKELKNSFLHLLDEIENGGADCRQLLDYILQGLIRLRERDNIDMAKPHNMSIEEIVSLLEKHFWHKYQSVGIGASRLPVLALYAVYECLCSQMLRYKGKKLLPLASHTSADTRSGRLGDIDVVNPDGSAFEAVEVKFDKPVSHAMVAVAEEKIQPSKVSRYYILSTKGLEDSDRDKIESDIKRIKNIHGCQLVINGIIPSLKYYLRLLDNTAQFIDYYAELVKADKALKYEHRNAWNEIISKL